MTGDTGQVPQTARSGLWARIKASPLAHLGPGLITGVADDDPSGIATYSQAGAQFGLNMLWTMPVAIPLTTAVQSMCARIGRVTGRGLAANIRAAFPPWVLLGAVVLLVVANTLNIAADVAAMGEVGELITGIDRHVMTGGIVLTSLGLQVFVPYHRYVSYLKWLTVSLLAYAAVLVTVHVPWWEVLTHTVQPQFQFDGRAGAMIVAVFGTTISPYLFFWQASEEVEDLEAEPAGEPLLLATGDAPAELRRIRWDTWSGMAYSATSAYFIILATAVTLNASGLHDIDTAAQAALALKPIAGPFAFLLFAVGILGVGMIGVPVLAGASAYAVAESFGWRLGLERKVREAPGFYAIIAAGMLAGLAFQYLPISPMKALFWSAVINGLAAAPLVVAIVVLSSRRSVMGPFVAGPWLRLRGWITVAVMVAAAVCMFWSS
jgi:Mn2+/Fe2+ NRAMP family transporter